MFIEKDAIVVNSADPYGLGRVQVFIYGMHDKTGIKIPFSSLPWATCAQSSGTAQGVVFPQVWSPIKVKLTTSSYSGNKEEFLLADADGWEWHSPSPFFKLTESRDPRPFFWDDEYKKFLKEPPVDYKKIDSKISELEEQKKEKTSQLEELKNKLNTINNNDVIGDVSSLTKENEVLTTSIKQLEELKSIEFSSYSAKITTDKKFALFEWNNVLTGDEKEYFGTYSEYENFFTSKTTLEHDQKINEIDIRIEQFTQQSANIVEQVRQTEIQSENVNENSKVLQIEITKISDDITKIDSEIDQLKSTSSSAPRASTSFESLKSVDARIARYDEKSGKVYDSSNNLIGNWTGSNFYVPGYAGQSGTPIPDLYNVNKLKSNIIKPESYLFAVNNLKSTSNNASSIVNADQNSSIQKSNNDKSHACDLSNETKAKILTKRQQVLMALKWLRDKIASYFTGISDSAIGQWVQATVKQITAILKNIQKFLKVINDIILEIAKITAQMRQLVNWILSLPARLLVLFQECLKHFFDSLTDAFSESIPLDVDSGTSFDFTEVTNLVNQAKSTFDTAVETVQSTTIVYTEIKSIEATFEKV
jgi:peptidoglycan hydrolase CwlO-like protein